LLGSLLIVLLVLLIACRGKMSGWGQAEIEILSQQPREYYYAIDINRASWVEWAQLDGIGEAIARRIVDERQRHGPFQSIEDLRRVRGVGTKLIEKLAPFLTITDEEFKELR
jgi:competence protein ComEA